MQSLCSLITFVVLQVAVLVALVAVAAAAPQRNPEADAQVLRFDLDNIGVDGYSYA